MSDRHYSEEEVSAIFQKAIEAQETARGDRPHGVGLTLAELQQIGADLGITPEFVASAAASIETTTRPVAEIKKFGMPLNVERMVELPRELTDHEWDRLVVDLRETFRASGTIKQTGSFRQWSNGNLQAHVEPTDDSYRLRLRTVKGNATAGLATGAAIASFGLMLIIILFLKEIAVDPSKFAFASMFVIGGLVTALSTAITVPRWHRTRSEQMDGIIDRVMLMTQQTPHKSSERSTQQSKVTEPRQIPKPILDLDVDTDDALDSTSQRGRNRT